MEEIQDIQAFRKLSIEQKTKLYDNEIERIEKYIYVSEWYLKQSKDVRKIIRKNKPWLLYRNIYGGKPGGAPVRLYGFAEHKTGISYLVATMDGEDNNKMIMGQIQDIDRLKPIHWNEIDDEYIMDLIKARNYGGDIVFLKPEMFLLLGNN